MFTAAALLLIGRPSGLACADLFMRDEVDLSFAGRGEFSRISL